MYQEKERERFERVKTMINFNIMHIQKSIYKTLNDLRSSDKSHKTHRHTHARIHSSHSSILIERFQSEKYSIKKKTIHTIAHHIENSQNNNKSTATTTTTTTKKNKSKKMAHAHSNKNIRTQILYCRQRERQREKFVIQFK